MLILANYKTTGFPLTDSYPDAVLSLLSLSLLNCSRIKEEEKGRQEAGEDAGLKDATFRGPGKEYQQTGLVNYYIYTYRSLFIQQLSVA